MIDDLPAAASSFADDIDSHLALIYWICGVWFVLVQGALFWALFRYRRREGVRAAWLPADTLRGAAWVLVPAAAVLVFDLIIEWDSTKVWAHVKEDIPAGDVRVKVTARQFGFGFTYAGGDGAFDTDDDFEAPELHVPADRVVRLELESADVLHSFYVPELRLKQDIVPGRRIPAWFRAHAEGRYTIACAELCGVAHSFMQSALHVHAPDDYRRWEAELTGERR